MAEAVRVMEGAQAEASGNTLAELVQQAGELRAKQREYEKAYNAVRVQVEERMVAERLSSVEAESFIAALEPTTVRSIDPLELLEAVGKRKFKACARVVLSAAEQVLPPAKYQALLTATKGDPVLKLREKRKPKDDA